jgi:hypothetical protein
MSARSALVAAVIPFLLSAGRLRAFEPSEAGAHGDVLSNRQVK